MEKTKLYLIVAVAMGVCALAFIIATGVLGDQATKANSELSDVKKELSELQNNMSCTTRECVTGAASLIESMDMSADPCNDFYQFACGGWIKKHPIPESKSRWTQINVLQDEVNDVLRGILTEESSGSEAVNNSRRMYTACMDTEAIEKAGLEPLIELLDMFGGWPMTLLQDQWNSSSFDWQMATATARKIFGTGYFFNIYNSLDVHDTNRSVIYVDQTSLGLSRSILVDANPEKPSSIVTAYTNYMKEAVKAIAAELGNAVSDNDIDGQVTEVLQFEIELAKITVAQEDRRNSSEMYNPMNVSTLQQWVDGLSDTTSHAKIQWLKLFNEIYMKSGTTIKDNETVIVVEKDYLENFVILINNTDIRTLANYCHWRLVKDVSPETTQKMVDLAFQFSKQVYGTSQPEPRSLTCVNKVNHYFGFATGAKYVEKAFDDGAKQEVENMIEYLMASFKSLVDDATWIDNKTKAIAKEKADWIRNFIAYPDWVKNNTALDVYYKEFTANDNHFENIKAVGEAINLLDMKTLRGTTDRNKWTSTPAVVNAFYYPEYNSITFPAGFLQPPFFGKGRPAAMNFGAIGVVIGHEITHGFDDQGRQYDKYGNVANWWTEETLSKYEEKATCFIDQYNNYTTPELIGTDTPHLNGNNTVGENIADNGGVREAFRAYKNYIKEKGTEKPLPGLEKYTPEQIFFISYANVWCGLETFERLQDQIRNDPHSPSKFRVLGPLSNSQDFVDNFQCKVGDMNRENKCVLW